MKKKYKALRIMLRVYGQTLKAVPISGVLSPFYYIIEGLFPAFIALVISQLFDDVYQYTQGITIQNNILFWGIILLIGYMFKQILQVISSITINSGVYERCTSYHNIKIADKASKLPIISYEDSEILNLKNRAEDCVNREVISSLFMQIAVFITNGLSIVAVVFVLSTYNLWLVPISVFSVFPYFIARVIRGKDFYKMKCFQAKKVRRLNYLWDVLTNRRTLKEMRIMNCNEYIYKKWVETRDQVNEEQWNHNKKDAISLIICEIIKIVGYGSSVIFAVNLVLNGSISIGLFGACLSAFLSVQESSKNFLIELGNLPHNIAFATDYYEFLDLDEDKNGSLLFSKFEKRIRVKDLWFKYPNCQDYSIKDINITINKGEKVVILGENGSGKTTLAKLILALYPPDHGEVIYDSINIEEFDKQSLYNTVSVIAQKFTTYAFSIRENIAISDIKNMQDDNKIRKVILEVDSHSDLIENMNDELGREFGGMELSGGQMQKLAIARGNFKESDIILIDEPTSAIDPIIETEILKKFIKIAQNKTAIIISHRVGLCKIADKIIVMKKGEVVGIGTHANLIEKNGEYARLYKAQEQWYV